MPPAETGAVTRPAVRSPFARSAVLPRAAARIARALPWQPWSVLGLLLLVQWAAVAALALTVAHNGWLYYQGGDESFYYTSAWALATGHLPVTPVGWGWPILLLPIALFAGPNFLVALPVIVVLQALLLLPIALASVYAIGRRLGGRLFGYWAAALWIAAPFVLILGTDPRFHDRYVQQFLPQFLGLTGLADFPSLVALLAGAALIMRALDERGRTNALLAGLVVGFAIGIKPSNAIFLIGAVPAFLLARRLGHGVLFGLALLPALVALAVWKQRGLGTLPLFAMGTQLLAAGGLLLPRPPSVLASLGSTYVRVDWHRINQNLTDLREFFWNTRLLQALPIAGALAMTRRSAAAAALFGGWFGGFFVIKGSNQLANVPSGSFFRLLAPGLPAYILLAAAIPLLVPVLGGRVARVQARRPAAGLPRPRLTLAIAVMALGIVPMVYFAVIPHLPAGRAVKYFPDGTYVPLVRELGLAATPTPGGQATVTWRKPDTSGVAVFYHVFRFSQDPVTCAALPGGTPDCVFTKDLQLIGSTRDTTFVDAPGPGRWWYTVGVIANWANETNKGDMLLSSQPVETAVR